MLANVLIQSLLKIKSIIIIIKMREGDTDLDIELDDGEGGVMGGDLQGRRVGRLEVNKLELPHLRREMTVTVMLSDHCREKRNDIF